MGQTKRTIHRELTKWETLFNTENTPVHDLVIDSDDNRGRSWLDRVLTDLAVQTQVGVYQDLLQM